MKTAMKQNDVIKNHDAVSMTSFRSSEASVTSEEFLVWRHNQHEKADFPPKSIQIRGFFSFGDNRDVRLWWGFVCDVIIEINRFFLVISKGTFKNSKGFQKLFNSNVILIFMSFLFQPKTFYFLFFDVNIIFFLFE